MGGPAWEQAGLGEEGRHQGPRQKLLGWQVVAGLVAQCLHPCGSLRHILLRYFAVRVSSSALRQRRVHMQLEPFTTVMRHALRPLASQELHPYCFFAGLLLVGIDGPQFDLLNTPQINAAVAKAATRRGEAAFAKLSLSVLVEVRQAGALRISFALCQEYTAALFLVLQSSQGLLDAPAQAELVRRVRAQIAQAALPPRRQRNCQRKVRRPVNKWPRMFAPTSLSLPKQLEVTSIAWRHWV